MGVTRGATTRRSRPVTAKPPFRIALCIASCLFVATVSPALAGKGGPTPSPTATITSDCNPCAVGTIAHFSGSGYDPNEPRGMAAITDPAGNTTWIGINFTTDGRTSFELYMSPAGTYDIKVLQNQHKRLALRAELSGLVVQ